MEPFSAKNEERLNFHYSRERRLEKASESVRNLNDSSFSGKQGLFRTLTATKPLAFLFLGIVMLSLTGLFVSYLLPNDDTSVLASNRMDLSAFSYQDTSYLILEKTALDGAYIGPVDIVVTEAGERNAELRKELVTFTPEKEQEFRLAIPYKLDRVIVLLHADGAMITLTRTVK